FGKGGSRVCSKNPQAVFVTKRPKNALFCLVKALLALNPLIYIAKMEPNFIAFLLRSFGFPRFSRAIFKESPRFKGPFTSISTTRAPFLGIKAIHFA
ncbi:hypothetical protein, partial [Sulfitobacter donghicola]|uniref:hypothetical protein n=1 Tax=Sulfitobacter donghicola TaxID=421000 RepID=UPI001C3F3BCE